MYLTQEDIIKLQLIQNDNMNMSNILRTIIMEDKDSEAKKDMIDGVNYYKIKQDILKVDFRTFVVDGIEQINMNASNNRIVNAYHRILVDQKTGYMVGKPFVFHSDDKNLELLTPIYNNYLMKTMRKLVTGTSNRGKQYLHVFINGEGNFDYVIIPAEQIIPVYDSVFERELTHVIRYYTIQVKRTITSIPLIRYKVEIWDKEKTTYFVEDDAGRFILDPDMEDNPTYHFYKINTIEPDKRIPLSWGKVPFVELRNNEESLSDLKTTKALIDAYDYDLSKYNNDLVDVAKAIWILKDYKGTSLGEFMRNLNHFKAIKVGKEGGAEPQTNEIPNVAHDSHLNRIEDNIFVFGMGVNPKIDKFGNSPSGIALKYMFAGLDLKSDILITEMQESITEFLNFYSKYLALTNKGTLDPLNVEMVFNKSILFNELEKAQIAQASKGIISDETILANHPWVTDVQGEIERLNKQYELPNLTEE